MMSSCLDFTDPIPEVDSDHDSVYVEHDRMLFIQSLKAVGNSFALVRESINGYPTYLMYEGLSDDDHSPTHITRSLTRNNKGEKDPNINAAPSRTHGVLRRTNKRPRRGLGKRGRKYLDEGANNGKDVYDLRPRGSRKRSVAKKRKFDQGKIGEKERICVIKTRGGQGNRVVKERRICVMGTRGDQGNGQDYGDSKRAYDIWLNNIGKGCGLENGNAETSSDSELEVFDKDPQCSEWKYTPISVSDGLDTLMKDDDLQYIGERSKPENPQFRKDVEDILRRPYDEKEYETLWLQMNSRKPMQGYRELRGNLKAYSKDALGKSYLDEYLDLRIKLDTLETDLPRRLNVLRGFFYYLKPQESKFCCQDEGFSPLVYWQSGF
ncbi:uncharacterized protein LOC108198852 isoform X2 [Daucus carota subsp. sativus]|uniref:uncharacterized protein LOC108198852 isoform X2 n=1 Tax=Daucus carota subsp. sativus TaxID=79200 RepID=UPI0007EF66BC|nr:PREDICTED: uncharacterized protein LOC108198852 isoform X2 [Daucus carota subsp. sativus]